MSLKLTINKVQPERNQITKRYNMLGACVHALARSLVRLTCPSLHDSKVCDRKKNSEVIPTVSFVSLYHPVIKFVWRS